MWACSDPNLPRLRNHTSRECGFGCFDETAPSIQETHAFPIRSVPFPPAVHGVAPSSEFVRNPEVSPPQLGRQHCD